MRLYLLLLIVGLGAGSGCKKSSSANSLADEKDCDQLCEKISQCTDAVYAPKGKARTSLAKKAVIFFKDKKRCISSCRSRIKKEKASKSKLPGRYRYFIKAQLGCVQGTSCDEFSKCQDEALKSSITSYPLDEVTSSRCQSVCQRRNRCAGMILPLTLGMTFSKEPEDKQAEIIRKWSDPKKCVSTCRHNFIKGKSDKNTPSMFGSNDMFFNEFSQYLNCLGHKDCGAFAQCVASQSH
ncbi:hypothetical protein KJ865_05945 [Myxococcota bacterium]|nr:hypothetical protein [Myxococcota bacterium]